MTHTTGDIMDQFEQAIVFATKAHHGQTRKSSKTPYILHPLEAAAIAATLTDDTDILISVILHDTVEDTDVTIRDIREAFGDRVASLVEGETEPPYGGLTRTESWHIRKAESLKHLKSSVDPGVKIMWMADKLSNMRSFHRLYLEKGDEMWQMFHQNDKRVQESYYREIADALIEYKHTTAYQEYLFLMDIVFGGKS